MVPSARAVLPKHVVESVSGSVGLGGWLVAETWRRPLVLTAPGTTQPAAIGSRTKKALTVAVLLPHFVPTAVMLSARCQLLSLTADVASATAAAAAAAPRQQQQQQRIYVPHSLTTTTTAATAARQPPFSRLFAAQFGRPLRRLCGRVYTLGLPSFAGIRRCGCRCCCCCSLDTATSCITYDVGFVALKQ